MAMHQPHARVIRLIRHDEPSAAGDLHDVATDRVVEVELVHHCACGEGAGADAEGEEVVSVQMDGVGEGKVILQDPEGPCVGSGDFDEIYGCWEGVVALEDVLEYRVVPFDNDWGVTDTPLEDLALGLGGGVK